MDNKKILQKKNPLKIEKGLWHEIVKHKYLYLLPEVVKLVDRKTCKFL